MNSKIETYIGFAIKKGSAVFGCDNIEKYRKKTFFTTIYQNIIVKLYIGYAIGCK